MSEAMESLDRLAKDYDVFVASDGPGFKRRARILQSVWRERQGYPMGKHRGRPLGSRLPMPRAKETLANYLTSTIRQAVRNEVLNQNTHDISAFDVFVGFLTPSGGKGFAGIEVKYSETLGGAASRHHRRHDEVAASMGCFRAERLDELRSQPLHQIWRDHLLAGSLLTEGDYEDGFFVFLYPEENPHCYGAQVAYRDCLRNVTFPKALSWLSGR